jgi:short-subunit dehydrogenase
VAAEAALPSFMWVEADEVARAGVTGLDKGRSVVIPGSANAVAAQAGRLVPRSLLVPLLARQHPALRP